MRRGLVQCAWLALAALLAGGAASAPPAAGAEEEAAATAEPGQDAAALLQRMAELVAGAQGLTVTVDLEYDAVQPDGQKIEFGETRRVALRRPDRLRVDAERRDGQRRGLIFDGKELAVFDLDEGVWASVPKAGSVDDAIAYFVGDLGMRLPLHNLLSTRLPEVLAEAGGTGAALVEEARIGGALCDHVAVRGSGLDLQVWVEQGERPLPRRIVITYKDAPGQPQFRATLSGWDLAPALSDSLFAFQPAEGAEKIPFAPRPGPGEGAARPAAAEPRP